MKLAISALLLGSASAYTIPTMMATKAVTSTKVAPAKKAPVVAKKAAPVKAAPVKKAAPKVSSSGNVPKGPKSEALPWLNAPYTLDGSVLGDAGFDPLGFTTTPIGAWWEGNAKGNLVGIGWLREAELMHGRIAQLAALGFVWPGLFGTLPGNSWSGVDAYSYTNPIEALDHVPGAAKFQIILFMIALEFRRIVILEEDGASHIPGDVRLGQGEGDRINPFGFNYSPAEYEEKQLQELNHSRAAMIGIFGLWAQAVRSGEGVVEQLSGGLGAPEYAAKAGYFFPEGI